MQRDTAPKGASRKISRPFSQAPWIAGTSAPIEPPYWGKGTNMIDGLIAGKLYGQPAERIDKSGQPFAVAKVRATAGDGENLFVNVIAFDDAPVAALLAMGDGDSVALAGSLTPKVWTDKQGETRPSLDMVATQVLTAYHATRKRRAMENPPPGERRQQSHDLPPESLDF